MTEATAHTTGAAAVIGTLISYWWVFLLFGGAILEWVGEVFNVGLSSLHKRAQLKHERRLELRRLELQVTQAKVNAPVAAAPIPGLCRHRQAVPVRNGDGDVVAWLCKSCDTQLPREFSVYEEDL
jgi:hypothetical protein